MAKQKKNSNNKQKNKSKKKDKKDNFKKKDVGKRGRLIVRNLPFSCTEENLAQVFGEFGKIIDINLPKRPDNNKPKGFGFVDFQSRLSADKANLALSGKQFMGRTIHIERAVSKDRFLNNNLQDQNDSSASGFGKDSNQEIEVEEEEENDDDNEVEDEFIEVKQEDDEFFSKNDIKEESEENEKIYKSHGLDDFTPGKDGKPKNSTDTKPNLPKQPFEIPKKKKARIIIRNLSFKTTEEKLKSHFNQFGSIIDLNLLRRIDNKLVGCAFVEYANRKSAVNAIVSSSGKPFLGRTIVVDWAIPVKDFRKVNQQEESKNEIEDVKIKEEILSDNESVNQTYDFDKSEVKKLLENDVKEELNSSEDDENDDSDDSEEEDEETNHHGEDSDDDDSDEEDIVDKNTKKRKLDKPSELEEIKKPHFESHDVNEGRTVFIKNVPFSVTNEDLRECVRQFGPIFYALVCVDPVTEHSRGTAFVKFQNKEDAEKCLSAGTSFTLNGAVLDPHIAIERNKIKEMKDKKKDKNKDSRNLYLIKEGVVLAGTSAANGVSVADMSRRLQLEQLKTQMLKNLNMFVSRNRLIIHNLPASYNDRKLKQLFIKYSKPNAIIQESRVMRDLKNVDGKGIGKSKGYGFVLFKDHEDALNALRKINNNPSIFLESKRPIVAFSIENKRILNLKQKRLEKSKMNNPLCSDYKRQNKTEQNENSTPKQGRRKERAKNNWNKQKNHDSNDANDKEQTFVGFAAKPGTTALRSKYKLKVQANLHQKNVNMEKKEKKKLVKIKPIKTIEKDPGEKNFKAKKRKNVDDDAHFSLLVNKYKTQLMSDSVRKKWYE